MSTVNPATPIARRLNSTAAAHYLGFSPKSLANWRSSGIGPQCVRIAGRIFYYITDLDAFIASGVRRGGHV